MKKRTLIAVLSACIPAMLAVHPAVAFEEIDPGIYRMDMQALDDLMTIRSHADLNVLVLDDNKTRKSVSDAHVQMLREWVESGGVLWVAGDGLDSPLAQNVAPFLVKPFDYVRSSSGHRGGELIVKGLSPRMTIADHELTSGVNELYLFARRKFDGTARAEPLVQMGDTAGNSGWVLAAVPTGRGYVILDGTARKGRWLFRRLKGFNEAHPNALKQGKDWNNYDWDKFIASAREHGRRAQAWGEGSQPSTFEGGGRMSE